MNPLDPPSTQRAPREAIVVLGMHRSGTSALARIVNLLGAALPAHVLGATTYNEAGHWESIPLIALHDRMLAECGSGWSDWRALDLAVLGVERLENFKREIRSVIEAEYGDAARIVIKEPRICRFFPLYREILGAMGFRVVPILIHRAPEAVARSLEKRNGMVPDYARALWLRHVLDAEASTQDMPRAVVSYETLLGDWRAAFKKISSVLHCEWLGDFESVAGDIDAFLTRDLQHFKRESSADVAQGEAAKHAHAVWQALEALAGDATPPALGDLEAARDFLARGDAPLIANTFVELNRRRDPSMANQTSQHLLCLELSERAAEVADKERQLSVATHARNHAEHEAREFRRLHDEQNTKRAEAETRAVDLSKRLSEAEDRSLELNRQLVEAGNRLADLQQQFDATAENLAAVLVENARANTEREALARDAHHLHQAFTAIQASRSWRWTAPLRAAMRVASAFRSYFGRAVVLDPVHELQLAGQSGGVASWIMAGNDPQWIMLPSSASPLMPGHYRLSLHLPDGWRDLDSPRLYIDSEAGFRDQETVPLYFTPARRARGATLVTLPRGARALRFDPSAQPGEIRLGAVRLRRLLAVEYYLRVVVRLLRTRTQSWRDIQRDVRAAIFLLRQGGVRGLAASLRSLAQSGQDRLANYQRWVAFYDSFTDAERQRAKAQEASFACRPLISIVMPVYNTPAQFLTAAIESVLNQTYENWELCIADDASTKRHVQSLLEGYAARDRRIKLVRRSENGHISRASNSALELATGDWIAFLDHDDMLTPDALHCVAETINRHPQAQFIYSDEDKIDKAGSRFDPYFKPDWNPQLLLSYNYVTHFAVYRAEQIRSVKGFRVGFEGAQDYDLALRVTENLAADAIVHIPHVLYHWRSLPGSTARATDEKPYAMIAGERALNAHFERRQVAAQAHFTGAGYRIDYALPDPAPLASIMIPTRNGKALVATCIDSIRSRTTYPAYEILLIDNGSDDAEACAYFAQLEATGQVRLLRDDRPFNFSALNNRAAAQAKGEVLVLLNNDIEVMTPDWLERMVALACQPGVGAVGAKLYYSDDTVQHAGIIMGLGGVAGHGQAGASRASAGYVGRLAVAQELSAVTAACLAVRKEHYLAVGGLNETDLAVAFNDVDFCLKLKARGLHNIWTPFAELYHHESATRGYEDTPEKVARFHREVAYMHERWSAFIARDPAYNPNLALDRGDFALAFPPRVRKPWLAAADQLRAASANAPSS